MDFTAVEKALEAIDRTKNLTQQSDVDKMAKDITTLLRHLFTSQQTTQSLTRQRKPQRLSTRTIMRTSQKLKRLLPLSTEQRTSQSKLTWTLW